MILATIFVSANNINISAPGSDYINYSSVTTIQFIITDDSYLNNVYYNLNGAVNSTNLSSTCFQAIANVTDVLDGSCSHNYSGTYANTTGWIDLDQAYDGHIITYAIPNGSVNASLYVNFSKPMYANNLSKLTIFDGNASAYVNLTIPLNCWTQNVLMFNVTAGNTSDTFNFSNTSCYNGVSWEELRYVIDENNSNRIYEVSMNWNIGAPNGTFYTILNPSTITGLNTFTVYTNSTIGVINSTSRYFYIVAETESTNCIATKMSIFGAFGLIAVALIAIGAFGIINLFKGETDIGSLTTIAISIIGITIIIFVGYILVGTISGIVC